MRKYICIHLHTYEIYSCLYKYVFMTFILMYINTYKYVKVNSFQCKLPENLLLLIKVHYQSSEFETSNQPLIDVHFL